MCSIWLVALQIVISRNGFRGPTCPWSYSSWILHYLCNQCLSTLTLWVRIPLRRGVVDTILCDKVCQWFATGWWFSPGTPVSSTNKTDCHDIIEILLEVALNNITLTLNGFSRNTMSGCHDMENLDEVNQSM
jgi:hypothetical protein